MWKILGKIRNIYIKINNYMYKKIKKLPKDLKIINKVFIDNPNITLGRNVVLYPGVQIWGDGEIEIGDNSQIGKDTIIFSKKKIIIGNNVSIAGQCYIIDCDHSVKKLDLIKNQPLLTKEILIEEDVWIGAGTKILKGSKIKTGAVIGAMSLVKGNIEEYSINVGIPCKKIAIREN